MPPPRSRDFRLAYGALAVAIGLLVASCGGGGSSSTPAAAPTASASPAPSNSASVTTGSSAQTASLAASSGYAGTITIPAASTGGGATLAEVLQTTLPTGVVAPSSRARSPQSIGVALASLAYITITPTATVSFSSSPTFTFTLPTGTSLATGSSAFIAYFNPGVGSWQTVLGPGTVSGQTVSFAPSSTSFTWNANTTYVFALYATAPTVSLPVGVANVAGNYSGTVSYPGSTAILSLSLSQSGTNVTGSWGTVYGSPPLASGGTLTGTVSGSTFTGTATASINGNCSTTFTGTISGSTLSGTAAGIGSSQCSGSANTGPFTVSPIIVPVLGTYSGTIHDTTANASGTVTYTLTQNLVFLTGTYSTVVAGTTSGGTAYGVVTGITSGVSTATFLLVGSGGCLGSSTSQLTIATNTITGSYQSIQTTGCNGSDSGTFTMTLQ